MNECNNLKQSPIAGLAGYGGGAGSVLFGRKGVDGYTIRRSLRFNSADSAYINRTPSSAGNRKTWTLSFWVKLCGTSGHLVSAGNDAFQLEIRSDGQYLIQNSGCFSNTYSTAVFRDYTAWQHFVIQHDATNTYCKIYINGSLQKTITASNADGAFNNNTAHNFNGRSTSLDSFTNFYLADVHFVDGQALAPSSFGETNADGIWDPKKFDGSFGTNGFHLKFQDNSSNSALGTDSSGNSNTWTVNNLSVASGAGNDSLFDSPVNGTQSDTGAGGQVSGNYCTLNPLESALTGINNGNLNSGSSGSAGWKICTSTMAVSSGKYYWEGFTDTTATETQGWQWGFCNVTPSSLTNPYGTGKWSYQHGTVYNQSSSGTNVSTTAGANDLLAYALDMDAGTCKLYVNNSLVHTFTGITGTVTPFVGSYNSPKVTVNFGARSFAYNAPSGYKTLCTTNLPDPTIADGSTAFDVSEWVGNSSNRSISLGFSPDFVWIKAASNGFNHQLFDIVRGANKRLSSNAHSQEATAANSLTSFNSDGFSLGTDGNGDVNGGGSTTYYAWSWDAGTSTASNTDGNITTNVRANQSAGFSIATYTGNGYANRTLGHGLGAAPAFVLIKDRTSSQGWAVLHTSAGTLGTLDGGTNYKLLQLDSDAAARDASYNTIWHPTSTTVKIGEGANSAHWTNKSGDNYVMYAWAPIEGFSSFGSFDSNNSTDNAFVYLGFRPRWVLWKRNSSAGGWFIYDAERDPVNPVDSYIPVDTSGAEGDASPAPLDFLSNGFKVRNTLGGTETFIYAAFAEHPLRHARAR